MQVHSNLILHKSNLFLHSSSATVHGLNTLIRLDLIQSTTSTPTMVFKEGDRGGLVNLTTLLFIYKPQKITLNTPIRLKLIHGSTYTNYFLDYI